MWMEIMEWLERRWRHSESVSKFILDSKWTEIHNFEKTTFFYVRKKFQNAVSRYNLVLEQIWKQIQNPHNFSFLVL